MICFICDLELCDECAEMIRKMDELREEFERSRAQQELKLEGE